MFTVDEYLSHNIPTRPPLTHQKNNYFFQKLTSHFQGRELCGLDFVKAYYLHVMAKVEGHSTVWDKVKDNLT